MTYLTAPTSLRTSVEGLATHGNPGAGRHAATARQYPKHERGNAAASRRRSPALVRTPLTSGQRAGRIIIDANGVEWEVYDDGAWGMEMALDWDYPPQTDSPGLIFNSPRERRRLWPCPPDWLALSDAQLLELAARATSLL